MALILDGKALSKKLKIKIKEEASRIKEVIGRPPKLAVILVGEDPASHIYVKNKHKACSFVGIESVDIRKADNLSQSELEEIVSELNERADIDGILVQLPLPQHINYMDIINLIEPQKDVDGFHPVNIGRCAIGMYEDGLMPCTPAGVIEIFKEYRIELKSKDVVMVGASNITGKPLACMMINSGATVCTCHIYTKDLKSFTLNADIVCVAAGVPGLIKSDMVKEGVTIIDIGINRVNGKLTGDVDFESVSKKAFAITPVPGGVGPMTVTMLLYNTVKACKMRNNLWEKSIEDGPVHSD